MAKEKPYQIDKWMFVKAFQAVKANRGAAGVDRVSIEQYEARLKDNLYKLWNRMSSGSYFPPAVRGVEIPKKDGRKRLLGIPSVEDRIAQMVVRMQLEPLVEPYFHTDSYGYRANKSAQDAIRVTRERCWRFDWVLEFDILGLFDNIDHELLMKAVMKHTDCAWVILYIKRWLVAPVQMPDGTERERTSGTPQGSVISPLLSNLFMHYAFDHWMKRAHPGNPWARYADDAVIHCRTKGEAEALLVSLKERFGECKLEIHPDKTRIIYCRDANRKEENEKTSFDFLGFTFRSRMAKNRKGQYFLSYLPAASEKACKSFREKVRTIRKASVTDSLEELAAKLNPVLRGWANYYKSFYASKVNRELSKLNLSLVRWVMRHYQRYRRRPANALDFLGRCAQQRPKLFVHWAMGVLPTV